MTSVGIKGLPMGTGLMEYGRVSRAEMIAKVRKMYERQAEIAKAVLEAPDEAFEVTTHTGIHVQRNVELVTE